MGLIFGIRIVPEDDVTLLQNMVRGDDLKKG